MNDGLKDILSNLNKDIEQEKLLQYLNQHMSEEEIHAFEKQMSDDELRRVISSQVTVVWQDKDNALNELRKFVMSKVEAEQLVLAVEDILTQIGDVPARMIVALHELAQKLNIID